MAVMRRVTHTSLAHDFTQIKRCCPALSQQLESCLDQRVSQITMVIGFRRAIGVRTHFCSTICIGAIMLTPKTMLTGETYIVIMLSLSSYRDIPWTASG